MEDQNILFVRRYISEELNGLYPSEEISSLVRLILTETTTLSFTEILTYPEKLIDSVAWHKIKKICKDLKVYRPIQYILGNTEFYGHKIMLNEHTLIPRQETEELVAHIIAENTCMNPEIIDIGTGSGALAIALSLSIKESKLSATDFSPEALKIAQQNSKTHGCNIDFILDDILDTRLNLTPQYNIVVSNPPYIRESEKELIHKNVLEYEPSTALFVPDDDPLRFYKKISEFARHALLDEGILYFEINEALGKEYLDLLDNYGFKNLKLIKDINNKDRIISATK